MGKGERRAAEAGVGRAADAQAVERHRREPMKYLSILLLVLSLSSIVFALRARALIEARHLKAVSQVSAIAPSQEVVEAIKALRRANDRNIAQFYLLYCIGAALSLASGACIYLSWQKQEVVQPQRTAESSSDADAGE